jgi:hypothetical protein
VSDLDDAQKQVRVAQADIDSADCRTALSGS